MPKSSVVIALRLGTASAKALEPEIDRQIKTARAEMIRTGVSVVVAKSSHELVNEAIVTFCQMKMGEAAKYDKFKESWEYQVDNLRKSNTRIEAQLSKEGDADV